MRPPQLIALALLMLIGCESKTRPTSAPGQRGKTGPNGTSTESAHGESPTHDPRRPKTRRGFAEAMSKVQEGMVKEEIINLLGKPDDIRTPRDPGWLSTRHIPEAWRYGTSGHLTTATLGELFFDRDGRVKYVFGKLLDFSMPGFDSAKPGTGLPPPPSMVGEKELRKLLAMLDRLPSLDGWSYDPLSVIQAVNALRPLGKEKALSVIGEYLRVTSDFDQTQEGIFPVLRVLFDVPEDPGYMRRMRVGMPTPRNPEDLKLMPRFPIVMQDDIPFLVVRGYILIGVPESPWSNVDHFWSHGTLRTEPLSPSEKPFAALRKLLDSPQWKQLRYDHEKGPENAPYMLANQLLWVTRTVYRVETNSWGMKFDVYRNPDERMGWLAEAFSKLKIRWDARKNIYTFADGKYIVEEATPIYRREIWEPKLKGLEASLYMERKNKHTVAISLDCGVQDRRVLPATVHVYAKNDLAKPIATFSVVYDLDLPEEFADMGFSSNQGEHVELGEGQEIMAKWIGKDDVVWSPTFKP